MKELSQEEIVSLLIGEVEARGKIAKFEVEQGGLEKVRVYVSKGSEERPVTVIPLDHRILEVGREEIGQAVKALVNQALGAQVREPALREPAKEVRPE